MRILLLAVGLVLFVAAPVLGQDGGEIPPSEPWVGMLASAAGLSVVVAVIMNLLRNTMNAAQFDQYAPIIAVGVAIVLSILYVIVSNEVTGDSLLQAFLVGLFSGGFSQNVNTMIRRTVGVQPVHD